MGPAQPSGVQRSPVLPHTLLLDASKRLSSLVASLPADRRYNTAPRALAVGGFVRDLLLGLEPKDIDLEVYGVNPETLFHLLENTFPGRVKLMGKTFGVANIHFDDHTDIDVAIPRRESKFGEDRHDFFVDSDPSLSIEEAARRRDFTMNAISLDLLTGEVFDPFHGRDDLASRILRATDLTHFAEDELRVYRGVQLVARFELAPDAQTFSLMREMVRRRELDKLPKERVTEEIKKLFLKAEKPSLGFEMMRALGIVERYYPELHALIDTPQEPEWHPEGDVWTHTMMALDVARSLMNSSLLLGEEERLTVLVGVLCHDLGKPSTTTREPKDGVERWRSLGHEVAGIEPTRHCLQRWCFSRAIQHGAEMIAKDHLKPGTLYRAREKGELSEAAYTNAVRKLIRRIYPLPWKLLLLASEADARGRAFPDALTFTYEAGIAFQKAVEAENLGSAPPEPLMYGRELLATFPDLRPGKPLGELLRAIEQARDEGIVKTKEEALEWTREHLSSFDRYSSTQPPS